MRPTLTLLLIISSFTLFAHRGEFVSIENVQFQEIENQTIIDFDVENIKGRALENLTIHLMVNDEIVEQMGIESLASSLKFKHCQFSVNSSLLNQFLDKIQIEIVSLFGEKYDWGGWDNPIAEKQVNTLASEFYADAPWRMKKTDDQGGIVGIPVHCFLHDADLIPGIDLTEQGE